MKRTSLFTGSLTLTAVILLLAVSLGIRAQEGAGVLRAGVARIDITPKDPVKLSGYAGRKELSKGVHDPLSARVVAFENGGKRLVLVSTDLIGFYGDTSEDFRETMRTKFKLKPGELFLTGIHTHAAPTPTLDKEKGHENNVKYTRQLKDKLIKAIGEALDSTAPVRMGAGIGYSPVGCNRREVRLDGSGWPKDEAIKLGRNPYGPTDKQV
ncbi:MAG: neutral/alkaline non-lysosomal ceramidase N-terminal domain-containing protein, partial [Planctomycetota bacterium]